MKRAARTELLPGASRGGAFQERIRFTYLAVSLLLAGAPRALQSATEPSPDLSRQIAALMSQGPSGKAGQQFAHAIGAVCQGTLEPSPEAATVSRVQLPDPGDLTIGGSVVWPDSRKKIDLGVISVTSTVPDNADAENSLAFDPIMLTDGIELSDDPLPLLRFRVYAIPRLRAAVTSSRTDRLVPALATILE